MTPPINVFNGIDSQTKCGMFNKQTRVLRIFCTIKLKCFDGQDHYSKLMISQRILNKWNEATWKPPQVGFNN